MILDVQGPDLQHLQHAQARQAALRAGRRPRSGGVLRARHLNHVLSSQHPVRGGRVLHADASLPLPRAIHRPWNSMWSAVRAPAWETTPAMANLIYSHSGGNLRSEPVHRLGAQLGRTRSEGPDGDRFPVLDTVRLTVTTIPTPLTLQLRRRNGQRPWRFMSMKQTRRGPREALPCRERRLRPSRVGRNHHGLRPSSGRDPGRGPA